MHGAVQTGTGPCNLLRNAANGKAWHSRTERVRVRGERCAASRRLWRRAFETSRPLRASAEHGSALQQRSRASSTLLVVGGDGDFRVHFTGLQPRPPAGSATRMAPGLEGTLQRAVAAPPASGASAICSRQHCFAYDGTRLQCTGGANDAHPYIEWLCGCGQKTGITVPQPHCNRIL